MDNKHGLADAQDGEFILNESGTSVSTDQVEADAQAKNDKQEPENKEPKEGSSSGPKEKDVTF